MDKAYPEPLKRSLPRDSTVNLYTAAVAADVMVTTEVARADAMEKADATATVMTTKAVAAVINGDEDCSSHT